MSVNLGQLAGRARRTEVESYDPHDDVVRFQIDVVSPKPLRFRNNLVDMQLTVVEPGLTLSGTNQRFGARGMLKIIPDGKLTLRSSEFEVREGWVRFDDATRIAPKVDVRAQTEYRRYASSAEPAAGGGESGAAAAAGATSGQWRINLHAHGDAEDLKVNLTSDPPLGQEDIVLLLTM
ncbi:MAG: translocation/assembly module TamB domain-containing protein, partial [Polyangiaceae bacterium]